MVSDLRLRPHHKRLPTPLNGPASVDTASGSTGERKNLQHREIFPWAKLPGELRNAVYELTLSTNGTIVLNNGLTSKCKRRLNDDNSFKITIISVDSEWQPIVQLLHINKQTHDEAAHFLYRNTFRFHDPYSLWKFVSNLRPQTKTWLEHLELDSWFVPEFSHRTFTAHAFRALKQAPNLKSVVLHGAGVPDHVAAPPRVLELPKLLLDFKYCQEWLEGVSRAKGDQRAGADVLSICWCSVGQYVPLYCFVAQCFPTGDIGEQWENQQETFKRVLGDRLEEVASSSP